MSATPINPPVKTKTVGGHTVTIFEIDPEDAGDGIGGRIDTKYDSDTPRSWNDVGYARNLTPDFNLDPRAIEVAEVISKLRAARMS
jgi:hypothetical protein